MGAGKPSGDIAISFLQDDDGHARVATVNLEKGGKTQDKCI